MITSNQAVGLKRNGITTRSYVFTKEEFRKNQVPAYAYDLKEFTDENGVSCVGFSCSFNQFQEPVLKD